jgi:hypothetical protein
LTSLDVSSNTALTDLLCGTNQLTILDVSNNTALKELGCAYNEMIYLNMKNGVTDAYTYFNATNNSLDCIETLDPSWATANWTYDNGNIDEGVSFAICCGLEDVSQWYVAATGFDTNCGNSEETPFATIQLGISTADNGDTVSVAAGNYVENINFNGKDIAVLGADRESTIINGNQAGSVVTFESGEGSDAVLRGFTITNGLGSGFGQGSEPQMGGGIYIFGESDPTLMDLIIKNNYTLLAGGGIFMESGSPTLSNVTIVSNISQNIGGGIGIYENCSPVMNNVTIASNTANLFGEGISLHPFSSLYMLNTIIWDNDLQRYSRQLGR